MADGAAAAQEVADGPSHLHGDTRFGLRTSAIRPLTDMNQLRESKTARLPDFTFHESLNKWNMPANDWLVTNHKVKEWDGLATAVVVFNENGRVLTIQRASSDSMPDKWELPGGAVDSEDPSILHGAARELSEESGLIAKHFTHFITEGPGQEPGQLFPNSRRTKTYCRFTFHAEVENCDSVKLDPNEHQDFLWASEEEIRAERVGDRELPITQPAVKAIILEGFRLNKQ